MKIGVFIRFWGWVFGVLILNFGGLDLGVLLLGDDDSDDFDPFLFDSTRGMK